MNSPKVTVLMSVYNGQDFLAEAIQSILDQSYGDFEFLIIDDGSTEPLDHILHRYKDKRIVIRRQKNMGLTRSLNKGLSLARGEYIARMDADDVSLPNRLENQVHELDADSGLDLVGCFFDIVDGEGRLIERKELITDPVYRLWRLQFHNNYGHGTVMLRKRSVLDAGSYDENLSYAQDYDLWSRISTRNNTGIIPEVLYLYRMVEDGMQASVKNYEVQLTNALGVSNRNLMACNPSLNEKELPGGPCASGNAAEAFLMSGRVATWSSEGLPTFHIVNEKSPVEHKHSYGCNCRGGKVRGLNRRKEKIIDQSVASEM
jgi:glycosyltransferase involved in cell wall biosynthesis